MDQHRFLATIFTGWYGPNPLESMVELSRREAKPSGRLERLMIRHTNPQVALPPDLGKVSMNNSRLFHTFTKKSAAEKSPTKNREEPFFIRNFLVGTFWVSTIQ